MYVYGYTVAIFKSVIYLSILKQPTKNLAFQNAQDYKTSWPNLRTSSTVWLPSCLHENLVVHEEICVHHKGFPLGFD